VKLSDYEQFPESDILQVALEAETDQMQRNQLIEATLL
jgi:hypothetical protein